MKIIIQLILFISILLFIGCEQPLEEEEFPYELKLVVRGVLESNKLINNIYIGRTLPMSLPYSEDFAKVTDAVGTVMVDNIYYPLRHIGKGIYTTDSLRAVSGKKYVLLLRWENKSVYAVTSIPIIGNIAGVYIRQKTIDGKTQSYFECSVNSYSNEVYAATWALFNTQGIIMNEAKEFESVMKPILAKDNIKVPTVEVPDNILNSGSDAGIKLYVYDSSFYDYYISQGSNQVSDAIFGQPGSNIRWNIIGDGIGMFIGKTDTIKLLNDK